MCIGGTVIGSTTSQWLWMPQVVILSHLCPKSMEATMYALLAGAANIGNTITDNLGGWFLLVFGVEPDGSIGESDQFTNLWRVSLIAVLLAFISVTLLFYLIPEGRENEHGISAAEESATN